MNSKLAIALTLLMQPTAIGGRMSKLTQHPVLAAHPPR
jgi:hypothetical protein